MRKGKERSKRKSPQKRLLKKSDRKQRNNGLRKRKPVVKKHCVW